MTSVLIYVKRSENRHLLLLTLKPTTSLVKRVVSKLENTSFPNGGAACRLILNFADWSSRQGFVVSRCGKSIITSKVGWRTGMKRKQMSKTA